MQQPEQQTSWWTAIAETSSQALNLIDRPYRYLLDLGDKLLADYQYPQSLHWRQRPLVVRHDIEMAYAKFAVNTSSQWGSYNGALAYGPISLEDEILVEKMLYRGLQAGQSEFIIMDIGAGNFQWGRAMANFINNHPMFRNKCCVTFISMRAEKNLEPERRAEGICRHYEFGNFQVENLTDEFEKRGLNLENTVDLMISSWCFRHLVDPVGTFLQAYNLLRPKTGHFFCEGFFLDITDRGGMQSVTKNLLLFFDAFQAPFFMAYDFDSRKANCFVIQKTERAAEIPFSYIDSYNPNERSIGSNRVTRFKVINAEKNPEIEHDDSTFQWSMYKATTSAGETLLLDWVFTPSELLFEKCQLFMTLADQYCVMGNAGTNVLNDLFYLLNSIIKENATVALTCILELEKKYPQTTAIILCTTPSDQIPLLKIADTHQRSALIKDKTKFFKFQINECRKQLRLEIDDEYHMPENVEPQDVPLWESIEDYQEKIAEETTKTTNRYAIVSMIERLSLQLEVSQKAAEIRSKSSSDADTLLAGVEYIAAETALDSTNMTQDADAPIKTAQKALGI